MTALELKQIQYPFCVSGADAPLLHMYSTVQYSTVQYSTVRYGTVRYGTVRYGTVRYTTSLRWAHPGLMKLDAS